MTRLSRTAADKPPPWAQLMLSTATSPARAAMQGRGQRQAGSPCGFAPTHLPPHTHKPTQPHPVALPPKPHPQPHPAGLPPKPHPQPHPAGLPPASGLLLACQRCWPHPSTPRRSGTHLGSRPAWRGWGPPRPARHEGGAEKEFGGFRVFRVLRFGA